MTIVATILNARNGDIFAFGDILLTDQSDHPRDRNTIPLQSRLVVPESGTQGVGLSSKAAIFGNYMLLWAGNKFTARALIREVIARSPTSLDAFRQICSETTSRLSVQFQGQDIRVSAILYHFDGETIWGGGWPQDAVQSEWGDLSLRVAGTGADDFQELLRSTRSEPVSPANTSLDVVSQMILKEWTEIGHSWSVYGGGYEFFKPKEGGGFERVASAVVEVSRFDHLNSKRLGWFQMSRIIQCVPCRFGSLFVTAALPSCDSNMSPNFDTFFAADLSQQDHLQGKELNLEELCWNPEIGISIEIDEHSFVSHGKSMAGHLRFKDGMLRVAQDFGFLEKLHQGYLDHHLADLPKNTEQDIKTVVCQNCGVCVSEANFIVGGDVRIVCDNCS